VANSKWDPQIAILTRDSPLAIRLRNRRNLSPSGRLRFHDINKVHRSRNGAGMTSESVGGIFGAIVAAVVLAVAVVFGPIGQYGKPPKPKAAAQTAPAAVPAAPAPRGPVIREVPNQ
jgi:hypothetical protein